MELSVRACTEADEAAVEALPAPEAAARRKLFGLTHAGALIETSHLALCVEMHPPTKASAGDDAGDAGSPPTEPLLVGFAALDDQVPPSLARWSEVRDYLKKRLQFGKPHGCVLLSAFRHDPQACSEREVLAALLHQLFVLRPELGGVVLAAPVGVDLDELGLFKQSFSCYDAVALSSGGLYCFFRAVRTDYAPSVFVRRPLTSEAELEHLEAMVKHHETQRRPQGAPWFDAATAPRQALNNQDEHRLCLVAQSVGTAKPCGLLACTDSVADDSVDAYARLFSELYRRSNPMPPAPASEEPAAASLPEPVESPREDTEEQDENPMPPPTGTTSAVAPAPAPTPTPTSVPSVNHNLERPSGGPPNIVVLGPTGAGKATQSQRLVKEFGVVYVGAGDLLRLAVQNGHEEAKRYMDAGDLVPDAVVQDLVLDRLVQTDCRTRGWLLEGFPRTEMQARVLIGHGARPDVVVSLELSDEDVTQRSTIETDAGPPEPAPVSRRVAQYRENREAVRQVFIKTSTVVHVDAARSRDSITRKLVREVYRSRGSRGPLRLRRPPRLVITGAPASGKGTQCELLVKALHVVHLSTGDMLRQAIRDGSPLGKQAQSFMDNGQLVPDDLIVDVVLERLAQPDCQTRGWLLDGFPRTESQAQALLAARDSSNASITPDCVLVLDVPDDEVVKRIAGRRMDPETGKTYHVDSNPPPADVAERCVQRSDDTEETVRTRLEQFHAHSDAVVAALGGVCDLIRADGTQTVTSVADTLLSGAERCLLRNNAVVISLFSMAPDAITRAPLFLRSVFEHFKEKDCVLLCLSERAARPAITSGFRMVHGNPKVSTISRLNEDEALAKPKKPSKGGDGCVLYAFQRTELTFLANFVLDLSDDNEAGAAAPRPVIVKGLGVKGFGRTVRAWGGKCAELLGFGRKKASKKPKQPKSIKKSKETPVDTRPRVMSDSADPAATSSTAALDDANAEEAAVEEVTRNTLH